MFYRVHTDGTQVSAAIEGSFGGSIRTAAWLIGGGPSLTGSVAEMIVGTPVPRMCINLAGSGLLRPQLWTSYDPSARFHRSVYLDAGIMKFVHRRRAMDLVPETTFKVCDCPQTYFFDRDLERGYWNFLSTEHRGIVDWADSMVQAIDIMFHLGIRRIYLAGCEMRVRPGASQLELGDKNGVEYKENELLGDYVKRCRRAGLTEESLDATGFAEVYHFGERKGFRTAASTDFHYYRVSQYLRLSHRSMSLAGVDLISTTPGSRLNDYFRYVPIETACSELKEEYGDPNLEEVAGRYRLTGPRLASGVGQMRDFKPHRWGEEKSKVAVRPENPEVIDGSKEEEERMRRQQFRKKLELIAENEPEILEEG